MPQQPHGLGSVPAGEGVGAEAAVDQSHVGPEVLILEVTEVDADLQQEREEGSQGVETKMSTWSVENP